MNGYDTAFPSPEHEKMRQRRRVRGAFLGGFVAGIAFTILTVWLAAILSR